MDETLERFIVLLIIQRHASHLPQGTHKIDITLYKHISDFNIAGHVYHEIKVIAKNPAIGTPVKSLTVHVHMNTF